MEGGPRRPRESSGFLAKPTSPLLVFEDRDVLASRENEVEVAPSHGRVGPPAVDHPPLLTHLEDAYLPDRSWQPILDRDVQFLDGLQYMAVSH